MPSKHTFSSRTVVLPSDNIDTDQIIPARFLKVTSKQGLGKQLFADWRYDGQGQPKPDFVLNRPENAGATVLVAGDNFGCGSSREHAPWALRDFGFRAVVSTSVADIVRNTALKHGLLPIVVEPAVHRRLLEAPGAEVTVSLDQQALTLSDGTVVRFPIDAWARYCILNDTNELDFLLGQETEIRSFEQRETSHLPSE